jgi:hypothetical protein
VFRRSGGHAQRHLEAAHRTHDRPVWEENVTTARQEVLCREYTSKNGIEVRDDLVFEDPDRSAWKPDGKREGWNAMLAAGGWQLGERRLRSSAVSGEVGQQHG